MSKKGMELELKVGVFVVVGVALMIIALLILGSSDFVFSRKTRYVSHFSNVEGLVTGAKVVIGGLQIGTVADVSLDPESQDILVVMDVARDQAKWVRKDSTALLNTQGVLGDKYVEIGRGSPDQPALPEGSEIPNGVGGGLAQFLNKGDQLMVTLQSIANSMDRLLKSFESNRRSEIFFDGMAKTARNLSQATERLNEELADVHLKTASKNLNGILEKINSGQGTLGALINDPGLYDDVKALMGGANRNRVMRNLVRQTIRKNEEEAPPADTGGKKK